jgi:hypothetical protein
MSTTLEGGCLCGAVRYRIGAEPLAQSLYQDSSQSVDVAACSLDRPDAYAPAREVWVAHRVPWVLPLAGVAQFEASSSKPSSSA